MRNAESEESDCSKSGQLLFLVFNLRAAPYDNFPSFLIFKIKKAELTKPGNQRRSRPSAEPEP